MTFSRRTLISILAVSAVAVLGYLAWQERAGTYGNVPVSTTTAATNTPTLASSTAGYTITQLPIPKPSSAPDFKAPLVFSASVSADQRATLQSRFQGLQSELVKDPLNFNAWIALGNVRKQAGDYEGAATDWQHASQIYPSNTVSFNNLGDLYMNFLHNYPAAESNYLQQIKNKPGDLNAYRVLFTLYSELYKQNTSAAEDILKAGIAANPQSTDLQALLDAYHQSKSSQ